jgi:diaminopimelate decarboxylase
LSFSYNNNKLCVEDIEISSLAQAYDTPLYIYSQSLIENNFLKFSQAFADYPHLICYAVKANSNLAILNALSQLGSGFDIVSKGELQRVIAAGGLPEKCVFSGVGKTTEEITFALEQGIYCFNIESIAELELIGRIAQDLGKVAGISIRVNPNVDAKTHPYISTGLKENKFGIDIDLAYDLYLQANTNKNLKILGIDCHIGSQITDEEPFLDALDKVLVLFNKLQDSGIKISHLDLGGGIGINYENNSTIDITNYVQKIIAKTPNIKIILEPGRAIVGSAGVFITQVLFTKQQGQKNFAIVDGAMNDLLRPSLYQAYHRVLSVENKDGGEIYDIVGPVCETGDYLAKDRRLNLKSGDLLAVMDVGAYGFVMASNYNTRPMVAEVMVKGNKHKLIRKRQTIEEIFNLEENNAIN